VEQCIECSGPAINTVPAARLNAAVRACNEFTRRVLAPTLASLRVLDTSGTLAAALTLTAPEESPVVRVLCQFGGCRYGTGVCFASSVGGTVVTIVLVVNLEDGESLGLGGTSVVAALCGLDGVASLCCRAARRGRVGSFRV